MVEPPEHIALLGVDVGGTFTDAVVVTPRGRFVAKRPTTARQEDGVLAASRAALAAAGIEPGAVTRFAHGTTTATNALLERRLARTALVVTRGFGDVLRIARQQRPHPFDLDRHPVEPVVARELVVEVDERIGAQGVVRPLTESAVDEVVAAVEQLEVESVAISLLHAWRDPGHEARLAATLRGKFGARVRVVASHELGAELREYERACTVAIDAALGPVAAPYLERLAAAAGAAGLPMPHVMQSSGGLGTLEAVAEHPARAVLSGPAGGVVAATRIAQATGTALLACIDVGGTSSDIALVADGRGSRSSDRTIAGLPIQLDMLELRTIGAGGSSIVHRDAGGLLRVGPRSAGSIPGPAAWGRGGTCATITDCHVLLGNLASDTLAHWDVTLDIDAARDALAAIGDPPSVAREAIAIAEANMAEELRAAIVARGLSPADATLLAYGGAGGLHACAVATQLGCTRVLAPVDAGVLSAEGLAVADASTTRSRSVGVPLEAFDPGSVARGATTSVELDLRFAGQTHTLRVDGSAGADEVDARFRRAHRERFGFESDAPVELVTLHVTEVEPVGDVPAARDASLPALRDVSSAMQALDLRTGTLLVPAGWRVAGSSGGIVELVATGEAADVTSALTVLERRLAGTCEEMGEALVRSACSPNITERRDCSTALFDSHGRLVAQAAHVPVHLGSMEHAVDAVLAAGARPGETWLLNDPYVGGTHLPDITLARVVAGSGGAPIAIAAARAHHADVGGITPGSMSPHVASIDEEGVRIPPTRIGVDGELDLAAVDALLRGMRALDERRIDLLAQHAALTVAVGRVPAIAASLGGDAELLAACERLVEHGTNVVRAGLAQHAGARGSAARVLELPDGSSAHVRCDVVVEADRVVFDLRGTDDAHAGSLNAPAAVTRAAAATALRVVLDPRLPAAACTPEVLDVRTRAGSLVHATPPHAVSGGNTEVSSVAFDCIAAALGDALGRRRADGQGTMNDLVLGWADGAYYETIAGGQGASAAGDGANAVHVAMTNTATTPTEVLELALPVLVEQHAVREGSGGAGAHRGGDGVVRTIRLLGPATVTFVSQRRASGPDGAAGGEPGAPGEQLVDAEPQPAMFERALAAGSVIEIRTPGGGGWGTPASDRP